MTTKTIVQDWSETGFEGPEKLLEVWFSPSADSLPVPCNDGGLKSVPRDVWVPMLDLVQCKVLSVIKSREIDAYLLSESSMFVFPHKIILKTCGTTTLLAGLRRLLDIAVEYAGFPREIKPWRVFYSRKNFMFPDAQKAPHKTWQDEMDFLDRHFDGGSAYQIGPMNGDHWYLYILSHEQEQVLETGHHTGDEDFEDETLEILMTSLDPKQARQFYKSTFGEANTKHITTDGVPKGTEYSAGDNSVGHLLGTKAAKLSGLKSICCRTETSVMDSFLFDPLGFSANMVDAANYATIHITPEPECSYASFETNMTGVVKDLPKVLDVFLPGNFTMTRFATKRDGATDELRIPGYKRLDLIHYELDGYYLEFQNWRRI